LGAFSRHVPKGMRRVEASSSNPDLLPVAFTDGTRTTLVVLNRSTASQQLHIDWPGAHWTELERTSFYSPNGGGIVPATVTVAPGEIVTLASSSAP
jgi:hypothetical protein